jgi:hypothetical protein
MQLGETIATYDVAMALRGESGKFDITSPTGEIFHVTCRPVPMISSLEWSGNGTANQPFLIQKVAEPMSADQAREQAKDRGKDRETESSKATPVAISESSVSTQVTRAPFLLESQSEESKSSKADHAASPAAVEASVEDQIEDQNEDAIDDSEIAGFDLLYSQSDPKTSRPSACVYLKNGQMGKAAKLIMPFCSTYIEFDAEVRRLHAQLDEIRSRAKKQFYKAYESAIGA